MIPFFAQAVHSVVETQSSDYDAPTHYAGFIACVFFTLAIAGAVKYLLPEKKTKLVPQPLTVEMKTTYADKNETDERFTDLEVKIKEVQRHFDSKFEEARVETGEKLDKMADDAVTGRRILHDKVEKVRMDMADIPEQTINLLLKTKELNR